MRLSTVLVVAFLVLAGAQQAQAWWCYGHMIVAEIAKSIMDPGVYDWANSQIQALSKTGDFPLDSDFVQAACWADDLKPNIVVMASWHFINQPINPQNLTTKALQEENVETVATSLEDSGKKKGLTIWEQEFSTAYIVHLLGDMHQPLHAAELYDSTFPHGDEGGNLFHVQFGGTTQHLHFVWDSVCGLYSVDPRPLNNASAANLTSIAMQIKSKWASNITKKEAEVWNTTQIGDESLRLAYEFAYDGLKLKPGDTISPQYVKTCIEVATRQLALAGARLGNELNYIYSHRYNGKAWQQRTLSTLKERHAEIKRRHKKTARKH